jgi:hypothetical protein
MSNGKWSPVSRHNFYRDVGTDEGANDKDL